MSWSILIAGGVWLRSPWQGGAAPASQLLVTLMVLSRQRWERAGSALFGACGLMLGVAVYPAVVRVLSQVGHEQLGLAYASPRAPGAGAPPGWLAAVVLSPLFEESLYRGQLLAALRSVAGPWAALLLTSSFFALSHLTPWAMLTTFVVGLALGSVMLATGDLWLCIGLHAGLNLALVVSGTPPQRYALPLPASFAVGLVGLVLLWRSGRVSGA